MNEPVLKFLRKSRTMTISTNGERLWTTKVYYALEHGFIFLVEKNSQTLRNLQINNNISFEIDNNKLSVFVQGSGKVEILGEPADFPKERGKLVYKVPEDQIFIKHEHVLIARLIPDEIRSMDMRVEMKRSGEKFSTEELVEDIRPLYKAFRPWSFQQSVVTFIAGSILAGYIHSLYIILGIIGIILAHGAFNAISEYFDYKTGIDNPKSLGGSRVLVDELVKPDRVIYSFIVMFTLSLFIAIYLIIARPEIIPYVLLGIVAGLIYGIPRIGFKYLALGDLSVFLAWSGIFLGALILQGGKVDLVTLLLMLPFPLLTVNILHGNNWRDINDDRQKGVRTVASLLGQEGSKIYYLLLLWIFVPLDISSVIIDRRMFPVIATFLTFPFAVSLSRIAINNKNIKRGMLDKLTASYTLYYGIAFVVSFILLSGYSIGLKFLFP
ncbi:MAG: UbiA family prenyltransferase [Thermoplasmata archaeon]